MAYKRKRTCDNCVYWRLLSTAGYKGPGKACHYLLSAVDGPAPQDRSDGPMPVLVWYRRNPPKAYLPAVPARRK